MSESQIWRFPKKYAELFKNISNEDTGKIIKALFIGENNLEGLNKAYYDIIKIDLDNLEKSAINGNKGGRPKKKITPGYEKEKPGVMKNDNLKERERESESKKEREIISKDKDNKEIVIANKFATLEEIIKQEFTNEYITDIYNKYKLSKEEFKEECNLFVSYWNERSINGKKCRWEKEGTFDIKLRFRTWMKNNDKWNKRIIVNTAEEERQKKLADLEERKKLLFNNLKKG